MIARMLESNPNLERASETELLAAISRSLGRQRSQKDLTARRQLVRSIYDSMRGFDILQSFLDDSSISEIMVNGPDSIFIERHGKLETVAKKFDDREHLTQVIARCFGRANRLINEQNPLAGMRFPDGSRVHAVLPPAAPNGPCLSIRRFSNFKPSIKELLRLGSLSPEAAKYLAKAVRGRANIFISGGTGSGKTSFLNALSSLIPASERIVTIEDSAELDLQGLPNLVRLEARSPGPDGRGGISLEELIRTSLRLRPDRIIVGEVRGKESFEMIQAMSTGHPGSMSTGHGNNAREMLDRLALMMLMASNLPWEAIKRLLASSLDIIVHLERLASGQRIVREISELKGFIDNEIVLAKRFERSSDSKQLCSINSENKNEAN
ncbi:MAG: CpaF family protein [Eubacteriales bacterium]|nr:CpaF family protein [Eubacteriales bacterium]